MDEILNIVTDEAVKTALELALIGVATVAGLAANQLRLYFGQERVRVAQEILGPVVDRAIRRAAERGLTGAAINRAAVDYIRAGISDQIKILRPKPGELEARIEARMAELMPSRQG